jgi:transposase
MNYIGLDVHEKTISYCVKDASTRSGEKARSEQRELDGWMKTLPLPWTVATEATK